MLTRTRYLVDLVDAKLGGSVLVTMLGYRLDYQEAHVPWLNHNVR